MQGYNPFEKRGVGHWNVTDASNNELQFGECCIPNVILQLVDRDYMYFTTEKVHKNNKFKVVLVYKLHV